MELTERQKFLINVMALHALGEGAHTPNTSISEVAAELRDLVEITAADADRYEEQMRLRYSYTNMHDES